MVGVLAFSHAFGASAPALTTPVTVTAVVAAGKGEVPRDFLKSVSARTTGWSTVRAALRRPKVGDLPCVKGRKDADAWLRARLKVEVLPKSKQVRLSLQGCARSDGLALLDALVRVLLENAERERRAYAHEADQLRKSREEYNRLSTAFDKEQKLKRFDADIAKSRALGEAWGQLKLVQKPRVLP
jgi:hypothetical protein